MYLLHFLIQILLFMDKELFNVNKKIQEYSRIIHYSHSFINSIYYYKTK